ncbi:hypothetical protein ACM66B_001479 [Microbotryomycetes sp. NB124-2]
MGCRGEADPAQAHLASSLREAGIHIDNSSLVQCIIKSPKTLDELWKTAEAHDKEQERDGKNEVEDENEDEHDSDSEAEDEFGQEELDECEAEGDRMDDEDDVDVRDAAGDDKSEAADITPSASQETRQTPYHQARVEQVAAELAAAATNTDADFSSSEHDPENGADDAQSQDTVRTSIVLVHMSTDRDVLLHLGRGAGQFASAFHLTDKFDLALVDNDNFEKTLALEARRNVSRRLSRIAAAYDQEDELCREACRLVNARTLRSATLAQTIDGHLDRLANYVQTANLSETEVEQLENKTLSDSTYAKLADVHESALQGLAWAVLGDGSPLRLKKEGNAGDVNNYVALCDGDLSTLFDLIIDDSNFTWGRTIDATEPSRRRALARAILRELFVVGQPSNPFKDVNVKVLETLGLDKSIAAAENVTTFSHARLPGFVELCLPQLYALFGDCRLDNGDDLLLNSEAMYDLATRVELVLPVAQAQNRVVNSPHGSGVPDTVYGISAAKAALQTRPGHLDINVGPPLEPEDLRQKPIIVPRQGCMLAVYRKSSSKAHKLLTTCHICYKQCGKACYLKEHERIHTGEKPAICKVNGCGAAFSNRQRLVAHAKSNHWDGVTFDCNKCDKHFKLEESLKHHQRWCLGVLQVCKHLRAKVLSLIDSSTDIPMLRLFEDVHGGQEPAKGTSNLRLLQHRFHC